MTTPAPLFTAEAELLSPPVFRAAWSDRMAWILATHSQLAYVIFEAGGQDEDKLKAELKAGGYDLVQMVVSDPTSTSDTQAFIAKSPTHAVLAFRGTQIERPKDVTTDLDVRKVKTPLGTVHEGFYNAYQSIDTEVLAALEGIRGLPLYLTGHSLGAALATLCTKRLDRLPEWHDQIAACYTFGSPRVGDRHFDSGSKASLFRVVNAADPVTLIAPAWMGYRHVGDERYLGRRGDLQRQVPKWAFLRRFVSSFSRLLENHDLKVYRRKLEFLARQRN